MHSAEIAWPKPEQSMRLHPKSRAALLAIGETVRPLPIPASAPPYAPRHLTSIAGLAALYVKLLDQLDLHDVTIIGNSIGGWNAARDRPARLHPDQQHRPRRRRR